MGTYAHYYLWAGVLDTDLAKQHLSAEFEPFLGTLEEAHTPTERDGLSFQLIRMHGETIGYGVILKDLDWITTEDRPESPDLEFLGTLAASLEKVRSTFKKLGLPETAPCNLYHHLDLGG